MPLSLHAQTQTTFDDFTQTQSSNTTILLIDGQTLRSIGQSGVASGSVNFATPDQFSVTGQATSFVTLGYSFSSARDFTNIILQIDTNNVTGNNGTLALTLTDSSSNQQTIIQTLPEPGPSTESFDLSSFSFVNLSAVTQLSFSFTNPNTNFSLNASDITLTSPVPEPSTCGMLLMGGLGVLVAFRRRR